MGSDLGSSSSTDCANLSFGFAHGDLIIQSVDGGKFHVHSTLLSLASPVFEDMFSIGLRQSGEIVEMAETSEMLSLMLQFIYPKRSPIIPSFDVLEKAFHIADKYQLEGMYQQLRERLSLADSPVSAYNDPLGALRVASTHGFREEVDLAISLTQKHYRLDTIDHLLEIADRTPASTPWIKLLAVPLIRNRVLSDVLLNFYDPPMRLAGSSFTRALCQPCSESHHYGAHNSPPEWQARWARGVLEKLKDRPIDQWEHYFGTKYLHEAVSQYDMPIRTPRGDCTCVEKVKFYEYEFLGWSSHVLECLKSRLKCLEQLEALR